MIKNLELTPSELVLFSEIIWDLSRSNGCPDLRGSALQKVVKLLRADFGASYIYDSEHNRSENGFNLNISPNTVNEHDSYWQFNDPITHLLRQKQTAATVEDVINRDQFEETAFFNDFLKPNKMHHGINIYFVKDGQDVGDMRIWKEKDSISFGTREKAILNTLEPYFTSALPVQTATVSLTARETEIATLIQKGYSDKEVAKLLDISHSTVRTHVKHVFEKLGCSNRTELATMLHHGFTH